MDRIIEKRDFVYIFTIFLIVQFGGLLAALIIIYPPVENITALQAQQQESGINPFVFVIEILIATAILLLIFRFYNGDLIYRIIEGLAIFFPIFYLFLLILSRVTNNLFSLITVSSIITIYLIYLKNKKPNLRNFMVILASIGIGVLLGMVITIEIAYIFLLLIAIYDYLSVFVTKHMVALAKQVTQRNLSFFVSSSSIMLMRKKKQKKINIPKELKKYIKDSMPYVSQVALGAGDLALPLLFSLTIFYNTLNYTFTFTSIIGSLVGIIFTFYLLNKYKKPLPAIPPLFAMINIALSIFFITSNPSLSILLFIMGILFLVLLIATLKRNAFSR